MTNLLFSFFCRKISLRENRRVFKGEKVDRAEEGEEPQADGGVECDCTARTPSFILKITGKIFWKDRAMEEEGEEEVPREREWKSDATRPVRPLGYVKSCQAGQILQEQVRKQRCLLVRRGPGRGRGKGRRRGRGC